ncbi:hypothetical protein CE91St41_33180 [Oscillospiraceae bacterium]|nr:hypothetical protein CE91St40_33170 [Oscillospiraceae bacterium]BDF76429.1 hypothetical protein CE91St41_33180 [Oscillospiraceae bacterium]
MIGSARGLPGEFLLVFTLLIWMLFILIYVSNPRNRLNFWCCMSGILFSMGVFKEYLYFTLGPMLVDAGVLTHMLSTQLYSVLTAVLYYFAMPAAMVFSFYFSHLDTRYPGLFHWARLLVFVPGVAYALFVPYAQTRYYQLYIPAYYLSVAVYNWLYGAVFTLLLLHTLREERLTARYRQRKMVAVVVLMPIWYWLVSAFAIHLLGLKNLFKLWQGNLLVILVLLIYYVYNVFRDGIWGTRLTRETYDWSGGDKVIQKNAQYVGHALKNEIAKIEWCASLLRERTGGECGRELDIIDRSTEHLKEFINRTRLYSERITLVREPCDVAELFCRAVEGLRASGPACAGLEVQVERCDPQPLVCDRAHLAEVLANLLSNAADAAGAAGHIRLSYRSQPERRQAVITVSDDGPGVDRTDVPHLFDPYHTTKATNHHLGLGLYYCYNVMDAHGGCIRVDSAPGRGSVFSLFFPLKKGAAE